MAKRVVLFALGGHIATQNVSYEKLVDILEPEGYEFFGAENGFEAFKTGYVDRLTRESFSFGKFQKYGPRDFAGFIAGAGRGSLLDKDKKPDNEKLQRAKDFFKKGKFDIAVASGGDDHGMQMELLRKHLQGKVDVYVINKTMDNDLGGTLPYTDFTNGFHTAATVGIQALKIHRAGAWTNNLPYLIGMFGRESNWVGTAVSYFGNADRFIYGELPEEHPGHSIERIHDLILQSQDFNERKHGRRFAMIVVAEGTRISGIEHVSKDLIDAHGHHKLNPESLVIELKKELEKRFKMKTQTAGVTYEMRNSPPSEIDTHYARISAEVIAEAIKQRNSGVENVFLFEGEEPIKCDVSPIALVSQKRLVSYHKPDLIDYDNFRVNDEMENYYQILFGKRFKPDLPSKLERICLY